MVLLTFIAVLISACAGPGSVKDGETTDIVTNTEIRENGARMVWVKTDLFAVYCTYSDEMYRQAQRYRRAQIVVDIDYESIDMGDPDGAWLGSGCDSESEGIQTYRMVGIRPNTGE